MSKKYSEWLKIDLHIHTDYSKKTKDNDYKGDFSVYTLHEKLTRTEVKIFSLTDHNIINLEAYKKYYENHNSEADPLLLVGVELDIDKDGKRYHSLLVFNYSTYDKAEEISAKFDNKYREKHLTFKNRKLTIKEIIELFPDDDFFFIPHAGNKKSIVAGYKGNTEDAQKMILLMPSALEKVPEKAKQKYNEGFDGMLQDSFKAKNDVAYIEFSDNHNILKYPFTHKGDPDCKEHNFYYIKGSKSYDTLRLAFIDPRSRIKSSKEYEEIGHQNNVIEKLKIDKHKILEFCELKFSPHMNVIIGGRSSGKSLLMNLFSKKIDKLKSDDKYDNIIDKTKVLIKSKHDLEYKSVTSITSDLIYINQGDIINYFENNKLEDLAKKSDKAEEYKQLTKKFRKHKDQMHLVINELNDAYKNVYETVEGTKYHLHKGTIDKILSKEFILKFDYDKLCEKFNDLDRNLDALRDSISNLESNLLSINQKKILELSDDEVRIINEFKTLLQKKLFLISSKKEKNTKKINLVTSINAKLKIRTDSLNINARQKHAAQEEIKLLIGKAKDTFVKMKILRLKSQALENFDYSLQKEIELDEQTKLVLEIEKEDDLKQIILEGISNSDTQKSIYLNLIYLLNGKIKIKNLPNNQPNNLSKKINSLIKDLESYLDKPTDFLKYEDGSTSKNNSPGFNSEKYVEIILKKTTTNLIFIDQPEDNLGNQFITEKLVDIFRDIKFQKQIFLVTHNPSIVVYGDAECIILAENNENQISYKQIVLEDKHAQKKICGI